MKRICIILLASCITILAYSQSQFSTGFRYLKGGISFNKISATEDFGDIQRVSNIDIVFGRVLVPKAFENFYIGYELGLGSRGLKGKEEEYHINWGYDQRLKVSHINLKTNPKVGFLISQSSTALDIYLGLGLSYDISGNSYSYQHYWDSDENTTTRDKRELNDYQEFNRLDCYITGGITLWFRTVGFSIAYQRGLNSWFDSIEIEKVYTNNAIASLAFRF